MKTGVPLPSPSRSAAADPFATERWAARVSGEPEVLTRDVFMLTPVAHDDFLRAQFLQHCIFSPSHRKLVRRLMSGSAIRYTAAAAPLGCSVAVGITVQRDLPTAVPVSTGMCTTGEFAVHLRRPMGVPWK